MPAFNLKNDRLLEVTLNNEKALALAGSMVAYNGNVKFEKSILGGEGFFGSLKRRVANEGIALMIANGTGTVYFAYKAREVSLISLHGEKLFVESSNLLAFEDGLHTNTVFAGLRGATSGQGLFTTSVEGTGNIAVLSHGNIIMLGVEPKYPLQVDPDAFVGYKGNLNQEFVFDVNWKTMVGQSSGESFQLKFTGEGVVYIQPSERK